MRLNTPTLAIRCALLTKVYSIHVTVNTDKQIIPFQITMLCSILVISWSRSWKLPQYHHHKYSLDLDSHVLSFIDADLSLLNQMIIFSSALHIRQHSNSQYNRPDYKLLFSVRTMSFLIYKKKERKQLLIKYSIINSLIYTCIECVVMTHVSLPDQMSSLHASLYFIIINIIIINKIFPSPKAPSL